MVPGEYPHLLYVGLTAFISSNAKAQADLFARNTRTLPRQQSRDQRTEPTKSLSNVAETKISS